MAGEAEVGPAGAPAGGQIVDGGGVGGGGGGEPRWGGIFDIADADYRPKPDPRVYARLVARHGLATRATVMVEDIARNLAPAAALGMTTVWVRTPSAWGQEGHDGDHVHHVADDLVAWLESVVAAAPAPRPG